MSDSGFYRALEERYYAPVSVIKELRKQYLPFIEPLSHFYPSGEVFDIGCGRGEWLELMLEIGMQPFGMDLDEGMLEECRTKRLPAQKGEAVAYLASLPNESRIVISAFHVVEHIAFDQLQILVSEALRVLKPGGLLIMETPNPENIIVATRNFYLDPTHQRPLPPQLLSFLPEYHGFVRVKTVRLQESKELANKESPSLNDVFAGASPDYAVIAQKSADNEILGKFEQVFAVVYGLEFTELARRYDQNANGRMTNVERRLATEGQSAGVTEALTHIGKLQDKFIVAVSQSEKNAARAKEQEQRVLNAERQAEDQEQRVLVAESLAQKQEKRALATQSQAKAMEDRALAAERRAEFELRRVREGEILAQKLEQRALAGERRAQELEERALAAECLAQELKKKSDELAGNCHDWWLSASALESERDALRRSWSWRITAPARWAGCLAIGGFAPLKRGATHLARIGITTLHRPIVMLMGPILRRPGLSYQINQRLMRYPALHEQLLRIARQNDVIPESPSHVAESTSQGRPAAPPDHIHLTPHARRIYADLKAAIERNTEVH